MKTRAAIVYETNRPVVIEEVELDVVFYEAGRGMFFQGSNLLCGQPLSLASGSGTIHIRFPLLTKNNGSLRLAFALWSKGREELFDWHRGIEIDVNGCPLSQGAVWLPCSFQVVYDSHVNEMEHKQICP